MTDYIAELDEMQNIAIVWIKERTARGPRVFDPNMHIFDAATAEGYFGASKDAIVNWIANARERLRTPG